MTAAEDLFRREVRLVASARAIEELPPPGPPEVCLGGRSNVGKSSLLNALCRHRRLARIGRTPGCTRTIQFYAVGESLRLVDLPGYGYAQVSRERVRNWTLLVRSYLAGRAILRRVLLLIDIRRGVARSDEAVMELLDQAAVAFQVVVTKADKVDPDQLERTKAEIEAGLRAHPAARPDVLITSATRATGLAAVRGTLSGIAAGGRGQG